MVPMTRCENSILSAAYSASIPGALLFLNVTISNLFCTIVNGDVFVSKCLSSCMIPVVLGALQS